LRHRNDLIPVACGRDLRGPRESRGWPLQSRARASLAKAPAAQRLSTRGQARSQNIACVGKFVLYTPARSGVPEPRRGNRLVLGWSPAATGSFSSHSSSRDSQSRSRRAGRWLAVPTPESTCALSGFRSSGAAPAHSPAAPAQFAVDKIKIDRATGGRPEMRAIQRLTLGLAGPWRNGSC